jgi:GntR family transcriptional regulator
MVPEPIYRQIADDLQRKIESGELAPGDQLPTEAELRDVHDASRNTVRDAMKWLISRGLIETRPGQGTFVLEKIDPFITTLGLDTGLGGGETTTYLSEVRKRQRRPSNALPRIEMHQAVEALARDLQITPGTTVVSRLQLRYIDDRPWSMQTTFYPFALVERGATRLVLPENIEPGAVRYLENELKVKEVGWRETIIVRAPDADESDFFQLSGDGRVAVFEVRRVAFEESGKPLRVTVTTYPADRNQFAVNVGRIPEETTSPEIASTEGTDAVPASSS